MDLWQITSFVRRRCMGHYRIYNTGPISDRGNSHEFLMVADGQGYRVTVEKIELAS